MYLVLEVKPSKCPNGSKHKVQLVHLPGRVWWCVGQCEQGLQHVAQGLDHAHFLDRGDLLEAVGARALQQDRDVALKQHCQVGFLRLHFTLVNPTLHISVDTQGY